jgi:hypothetical protein
MIKNSIHKWMDDCQCCFYCGQPRPCDEMMNDFVCMDVCECASEEIEQWIFSNA